VFATTLNWKSGNPAGQALFGCWTSKPTVSPSSDVSSSSSFEEWEQGGVQWEQNVHIYIYKYFHKEDVRLYDTVKCKVIEAHLNEVALWNSKFTSSVEGITKIAETDGWHYPIEGILGIAVDTEDDSEPVALPLDKPRALSNKHKYVFSVNWRGYDEPSWEPYSHLEHTSSLLLFARTYPVLKLVK